MSISFFLIFSTMNSRFTYVLSPFIAFPFSFLALSKRPWMFCEYTFMVSCDRLPLDPSFIFFACLHCPLVFFGLNLGSLSLRFGTNTTAFGFRLLMLRSKMFGSEAVSFRVRLDRRTSDSKISMVMTSLRRFIFPRDDRDGLRERQLGSGLTSGARAWTSGTPIRKSGSRMVARFPFFVDLDLERRSDCI